MDLLLILDNVLVGYVMVYLIGFISMIMFVKLFFKL